MSLKDIKITDYLISLWIILALIIIPIIWISYLDTNDLLWFLTMSNLQILILSFLQVFIPILGGFLYLFLKYKKLFKEKFNNFKSRFNLKIVLIWFLALSVTSFLYEKFIKYLWLHFQSNYFEQIWNSKDLSLISFFLLFAVIAAVYEELLFRWFLFDFFKKAFWKIKILKNRPKLIIVFTILTTSILFWLIHMQYDLLTIVNVIFLWIILWFIRYKYWLINSIFVHVLNNFIIIFVSMFLPTLVLYLSYHNYLPNNSLSLIQKYKKENNFLILSWDKKANLHRENFNKYIYKYFLFQGSALLKCNFPDNLTIQERKNCLNEINNLEKKFKWYLNLYKCWILNDFSDLKQIKETISYISNLKNLYDFDWK